MSILGVLPDSMPGDKVSIIDNSTYSETLTNPLTDPIALFAFVSPKGVGADNTLVSITSTNVGDYGTPNLAKWGVSLYNVNNYISGGGSVIGMRIMPQDATLANIAVLAKYQLKSNVQATDTSGNLLFKDTSGNTTTTSTGNTPITRDILDVVLTTQSFSSTNATSVSAIGSALDALRTDVVDANGYKTMPLFAIYERSLGTFGNNITFRLAFDSTMESGVATERFYQITAVDTSTTSKFCDPVSFTFDPDYLYNGAESMYATDSMDAYNKKLGIYCSRHLEAFRAIVSSSGIDTASGETSANDIDILFGLSKTSTPHYKYVVDATSVSLSNTAGLALAGGSDGAFDSSNDTHSTAISTAMANVYNGTVTDLIYDELRYPFVHIFDNDDSQIVKDAVNDLANSRYTSLAVLSAPPTLTTYTQMDSLRASVYKYKTFSSVWYTESAMVIDPYTAKRVRMPASYFNSYAFAQHCTNGGYATPFAGQYFQWAGFIANSMQPQSTSQDVLKQEHANRINQMFEDGKGTATPYQQITMQSLMSELSELNNVHILKYMILIALQQAKSARWNFNTTNAISKFQKQVTDAINQKLGNMYASLSIACSKESANGAGANRILATINVSFNPILKGVTYQFYIN